MQTYALDITALRQVTTGKNIYFLFFVLWSILRFCGIWLFRLEDK